MTVKYDQKVVDGQTIKERVYRITGEGEKALRKTFGFYGGMIEGRVRA